MTATKVKTPIYSMVKRKPIEKSRKMSKPVNLLGKAYGGSESIENS